MLNIGKAAVLGAGTMGAGIAAHLANAGIPVLLLDIAAAGEDVKDKNAVVKSLFEAAKKLKPAPFMLAENANLITLGNFEDDMARLKDCDFVIEAVVERLDIKHKVFAEVEKHRKPGAVVASNTSGIPIESIAEPFSEDFKRHFVGIHFFNPPRYMKLVEVIPTKDTSGEVACAITGFLDRRLGKGVVPAKDRPNFIANRIGVFSMMATIKEMIEMGLTPTEVDQITGKAIGHASSATFRRIVSISSGEATTPSKPHFAVSRASLTTCEATSFSTPVSRKVSSFELVKTVTPMICGALKFSFAQVSRTASTVRRIISPPPAACTLNIQTPKRAASTDALATVFGMS